MPATLQKLGVMPSLSRPSVSDDNPYSEALFKTLKYYPGYPDKPFNSLEDARQWVLGFVHWYNETHRHSALRFVTPGQRHRGDDIKILAQRRALYEHSKTLHPERWSGATRNWKPEQIVHLNPGGTDENGGGSQTKCDLRNATPSLTPTGPEELRHSLTVSPHHHQQISIRATAVPPGKPVQTIWYRAQSQDNSTLDDQEQQSTKPDLSTTKRNTVTTKCNQCRCNAT